MQKVWETICTFEMIKENDIVVVGVSGGADSVCLLFVLKEYQKIVDFSIVAVHVEHGIRGEESLRDAAFVKELCHSLEIPCELYYCAAKDRAKEENCSLEEGARLVRYEAFREAAQKYNGTKIATAHNQNDQAETVLWNLIRGSGVKGLGGIRPSRDCFIRPLLFVSRNEIEEYLQSKEISYCTDSTNLSDDYTRNKLRNCVFPYLQEELNAKTIPHIAEAAERLQRMEAYVAGIALMQLKSCQIETEKHICLNTTKLKKNERIIREYIYRSSLEACGCGLKNIGKVHLDSIEELLYSQPGKEVQLPGNYLVSLEQSGMWFKEKEKKEKKENFCLEVQIPGKYEIDGKIILLTLEPFENQKILEKICTKWLDYDKIEDTVFLRFRNRGDYFVTNQDGGRKKLKSYFIDQKIPREERERQLLLAVGSHILWIIGKRISEAYKVTKDTKNLLRIQIMEDV